MLLRFVYQHAKVICVYNVERSEQQHCNDFQNAYHFPYQVIRPYFGMYHLYNCENHHARPTVERHIGLERNNFGLVVFGTRASDGVVVYYEQDKRDPSKRIVQQSLYGVIPNDKHHCEL